MFKEVISILLGLFTIDCLFLLFLDYNKILLILSVFVSAMFFYMFFSQVLIEEAKKFEGEIK